MSGPRLSIIPAGAIFDRTLEPRDLQVLNLLGCHTDKAGWCRRSQVRMATELDCSRSSVQRSLDRLAEAGWVQKKRVPWAAQEGQPSGSYMYRVVLDRDDQCAAEAQNPEDSDAEKDAEGHAENAEEMASEDGEGCPPVGTPAQPDGHPGAQPYVGTGAHTYVGTKNDPLERPPLERERDARARELKDRNARFLAAFEQRWPTAAQDDRQRTAYAAEGLSEQDQEAALAGIGPFLEDQKRQKRKVVPAGWKYLEQKRWTLLSINGAAAAATSVHPLASPEGRAICNLFEIAGLSSFLRGVMIRDGKVSYLQPVTAQILALAEMPLSRDAWPVLDRRGVGSWEDLLRSSISVAARRPLKEGDRAPWPFAPSKEGKLYTATGPPALPELSEQEMADFK